MSYSFSKTLIIYAIAAAMISTLMLTASCGKKPVTTQVTPIADQTTEDQIDDGDNQGISDMELEEQRIREQAASREKYRFLNENIQFDYDSSALSSQAKRILQEKAGYLKKHPNLSITVQGHCDERGTTEYNLGLGERRAVTVKHYLENLGISSSRVSTVSYGEEEPLDPAHTPAAWAINRRAQFVIQ